MSRNAGLDDAEVFRAVVTRTYPAVGAASARAYTAVYGPYRTLAAARAAVTRETRVRGYWRPDHQPTAIGHVERGETVWTPVDKEASK